MPSKAQIAGRPLHPMLVGFPIALFAATIGLELAHIGTQDAFYYRAAMIANITGVMMALIAVVPGAIDLASMPAGSPSRSMGIKHALLSSLTIAVFTISGVLLLVGWSRGVIDAHVPLALGMIGIVAMTYGGALGYALEQTHDAGIRPTIVREIRTSRNFEAVLHN